MARSITAYVSAHQRDRVHVSRAVRGDVFTLMADFNGAIAAARTLASVEWLSTDGAVAGLADASCGDRSTAVSVTAGFDGCAWIKCVATLDNDEVRTQRFQLDVSAGPYFDGESTPTSGATSATATNP